MTILSSLYGFEFGKIGFSLHLSRPNESWYRTFDDIKLEPSRTSQMHYDLEYAIPKAMLYLNDVGIEQGPFSYITSPQNWNSNGFKLCLAKEIDYAVTDFLSAVGKLKPNEQLYRNEFSRKLLSSLPKALRLTAIPGNHVLDTDPLSVTLLNAEKNVTGPAGTFCLFTGSDVLHRGGIVQKGERIALQICFYPKDEKYFKTSPSPPISKGRKFSNEDFSRKLVNICPERDIIAVDAGGAVEVQPHWHRLPKIAKTYIFEPHEESFLSLIERQKTNSTYIYNHYLMIALAEKNGKRILYKTNEATGSSLLPPHNDAICNFPQNDYFHPITEEEIEVQSLASVLEYLEVKHVDAIKLDTQGTELEILKGLGSSLSKDLLLIEIEIPVIENYKGSSTNLPEVIEYTQGLGLDLFDMRCNRFPGNSVRKGIDFAPNALNAKWGLPSMGERLNEVDAVFFKDPRKLVDENVSPEKFRKLISLLAVYYFFPEAAFAIDYAHSKGLFRDAEKVVILETLRELHNMARQQARIYEKHLDERNGLNWGQYMHLTSPST
jgi:FkbM family methyltransferase